MLGLPLTLCLIKRRVIESRERSSRSFDPIRDSEVSLLLQKPHALVLLLPDANRQILEMAFFDGTTSVEITKEAGFSIDMIGTRLRGVLSTLTNGIADLASVSEDTRLEVLDLDTHPEFMPRSLRRHPTINISLPACGCMPGDFSLIVGMANFRCFSLWRRVFFRISFLLVHRFDALVVGPAFHHLVRKRRGLC